MKGKHFPGHLGDEITTVKNLRVLDVISDDGLIIVNGCVPGAKNAAVSLNKL
jgi:large subunit ribosomal protein L3